jgi:hypothetical protein
MIRDVYAGSRIRILSHTGSEVKKTTGSRIRIRNTALPSGIKQNVGVLYIASDITQRGDSGTKCK